MKGNSQGVSFNDRELAGKVRSMGLVHLEKVLSEDYPDKSYQKELLLKIASSLLPRLNEHSGPDGKPIPLFDYVSNRDNNSNSQDKGTEK